MRKGDAVYFAPDYTFSQLLDTTDPIEIIGAYKDRISGFYLETAKSLMKSKAPSTAFAAGIMCFAAIDAIARTELGLDKSGLRVKTWLHENLPDFKNLDDWGLRRVYDEFRCGLMHEARIKNGGQFTYEIKKAIEIKADLITINPERLLQQIETAFNRLITEVSKNKNDAEDFRDLIIEDFKIDIQFLEDQLKCGNPDCANGKDGNTEEDCKYCNGSGIDPYRRYERELDKAEDAAEFSK